MEKRKECEIGCKQETRENSSLRTQRIFGMIRNVYHKIEQPRLTIHSPAYKAAVTKTNYKIIAEQKKAEAELLLTRKLTLC